MRFPFIHLDGAAGLGSKSEREYLPDSRGNSKVSDLAIYIPISPPLPQSNCHFYPLPRDHCYLVLALKRIHMLNYMYNVV